MFILENDHGSCFFRGDLAENTVLIHGSIPLPWPCLAGWGDFCTDRFRGEFSAWREETLLDFLQILFVLCFFYNRRGKPFLGFQLVTCSVSSPPGFLFPTRGPAIETRLSPVTCPCVS